MDIKNTNGVSRIEPVDAIKPETGRGEVRQQAAQREPAGEQVTLTPTARSVLAAADEAGAPLDSRRVQAIRDAIADGTYQVSPERIAAGLIRIETGLPR